MTSPPSAEEEEGEEEEEDSPELQPQVVQETFPVLSQLAANFEEREIKQLAFTHNL